MKSRVLQAPITRTDASIDNARELAHDLNNLLTAIIGTAEAVLERSGIDPETRADIAHIREGARRGAVVTRSLGAARPREQPGFISINEAIRATSRLLTHRLGTGIALRLDLAEPGGLVCAEPSQLDRVLLNLVANARHAMPNGGSVILVAGTRMVMEAETRTPDTIPPGDYVVITVTDTGGGIPGEALPRIFEPGFTLRRQSGGSGVGLASVRDIIGRIDGFVAVESIVGQGTCFEVYLPRRHAPSRAIQNQPGSVRTVLLVEDEPLVRQVAERVLLRAGWTVLGVESAEAALAILKVSRCDLMISDLMMPGMDGIALARLALKYHPGLPVILTSGYEPPDAHDELEIGALNFLTKPYGQNDLLEMVARCVARAIEQR